MPRSILSPQFKDGPVGARYADNVSAFTAGINVAATFNRTLMAQHGTAMGAEFRGKGINVALGPMIFGGDPYLSGEAAFEVITGIQSQGVQATAKHYINNEQEHFRDSSSSNVDDSVSEPVASNTKSISLRSYACENDKTLNGLLKGELGFPGYVMSGDISAGSGTTYFGQTLVNAVQAGSVLQSRIDDIALRILAACVIRNIGAASTVLLKNTKNVLPLASPKSIGIIGNGAGPSSKGPNGYTDRAGDDGVLAMGWGSGTAQFPYLTTPLDAIAARANTTGTIVASSLSDTDLNAAANVASGKAVAIVFITADSGEGYLTVEGLINSLRTSTFIHDQIKSSGNAGDRNDLQAWHGGDTLVTKVAGVNSNTIVVVNSVGPIIMEAWVNHVNVTAVVRRIEFHAIYSFNLLDLKVWSGLPGQEAGVYFPSGLIRNLTNESEGLFIDYRHFDQNGIAPRFEFGFGLSYTTFDYSGIIITGSTEGGSAPTGSALDSWLHTNVITVSFTLKNNGTVAGHEIPQLYTTPPASIGAAPKNLKGFDSIFLGPGQGQTVTLQLSRYDLSFWNARGLGALKRAFATYTPVAEKPCSSITPPYAKLIEKLDHVRRILNRPLTLSEKILYSHLVDPEKSLAGGGQIRGHAYLQLHPERVAMQDASAHLQFMSAGLPQCAVPTSIHCDHLIQASEGADADLKTIVDVCSKRSIITNQEVFDFLESASRKYGIEFWGPGSGIIHQIVLENYAAPGMLMSVIFQLSLITRSHGELLDSHTPNAGGLGMLAIGVGGADAVDAMTGTPWELKAPQVVGVRLTGSLNGWSTTKDLILHLAGKLTVRVRFLNILVQESPINRAQVTYIFFMVANVPNTPTFWPALATIANMGAEVGATTSTFPYTAKMNAYLRATGRAPVAMAADEAASRGFLAPDEGAEYDEIIEINLSDIEPTINGPFTPDLATPISKFGAMIEEQGWKDEFSAGLIGSCTNSSYEDMTRVADLAKQAQAAGLKTKVPFLCTPGSEQIRATMERDNVTSSLEGVGAVVLANACGPCIGQWKREDKKDEENAILTSFNRNFKSRNDGNRLTMNFLASPTIVTAMAFSGKLSFNPITDSLKLPSGEDFRFTPPSGQDLPSRGFTTGDASYYPQLTPQPQPEVEVVIKADSQRLEPLEPFASHFGPSNSRGLELPPLKVLMRVRGKCTTDHISAAGPWLKYKGHLTNISENLLITAVNDEGGDVNKAFDRELGVSGTIPEIAKSFKARGQPWALIVDENYGEGSAREHAALQPRFYGGSLILARSFARIHETNLKVPSFLCHKWVITDEHLQKQGVLPLWFVNKGDYERIGSGDVIETVGLADTIRGVPGATIKVRVTKSHGEVFEVETKHTMSTDQLKWLKAGSALNYIRSQKL
ncbi:hypothetical protein H0H93_014896 [Arthromyces matolae]|nr:hypothetical protein H0H93_014896 [Arthromyces matolae]